jgi:hypothetical protein
MKSIKENSRENGYNLSKIFNQRYHATKSDLLEAQTNLWKTFDSIRNTISRDYLNSLPLAKEIIEIVHSRQLSYMTLSQENLNTTDLPLIGLLKLIYEIFNPNRIQWIQPKLEQKFLNAIVVFTTSYNEFVKAFARARDLWNGSDLMRRRFVPSLNKTLVRKWTRSTIIIGILHKYPPVGNWSKNLFVNIKALNLYPPFRANVQGQVYPTVPRRKTRVRK